MLLLIDYGIGNIRSLEKAFEAVGAEPVRSGDPTDIARASKIVLPGVGAFGACADELKRRGLWEPVRAAVRAGTPLLGVCVGMQLLFEASEEMGEHAGLGLLPGRVVRFDGALTNGRPLKVPHMGWNTVRATRPSPLLAGIAGNAHFYFVHSYHAAPERADDVLGLTEYGAPFPAVVEHDNVAGVQFHPEKSQDAGLRLLRNFADRGTD